jgi:hypothetical protein
VARSPGITPYQRWTPPRDGQIVASSWVRWGRGARASPRGGSSGDSAPTASSHLHITTCRLVVRALSFSPSATENRTGSEYWCQRRASLSSRIRPANDRETS